MDQQELTGAPRPEDSIQEPPQEQHVPQEEDDLPSEILSKLRTRPEKINEILAELDDESFTKLDVVNKRIDRYIGKKSKEIERRFQEQKAQEEEQRRQAQAQRYQAMQIVNQIESLPRDQYAAVLSGNPTLLTQYTEAKKLLSKPADGPNEYQIIDRVWQKAREAMESKYEIDLKDAKSLEDVIDMAADTLTNKQVKALEEKFEAQMKALRSELAGVAHRNSDVPERGTSGGASGKRVYTRAEIANMSLEEFKKNEADIDAAAREGRIK